MKKKKRRLVSGNEDYKTSMEEEFLRHRQRPNALQCDKQDRRKEENVKEERVVEGGGRERENKEVTESQMNKNMKSFKCL